MKTPEEIQHEINKLAVVCQSDSPVPTMVRELARAVCHTLTWVMKDDVSINPYEVLAGCCCLGRKEYASLAKGCTIGEDMCLSPGHDSEVNPQPQDVREMNLFFKAWIPDYQK